MTTKIKSGVIGDNVVGITQLNVSDGTNGQVLITDGSGTLSFADGGVDGIVSSADATAITIDSSENVTFTGTGQATRLGLGVAPHATAALNITTTDQHMRLNNGAELGIIELDSDGHINIWAHGDNETINLRTGSGSGSNVLSVVGNNVGIGTDSLADTLHVKKSSTAVGEAILTVEGGSGGYGTGISFQSTLTGGSLAEMAKIVADGEAAWNTTASTQDAGLRFFTTGDGTSAERMKISGNGDVTFNGGIVKGARQTINHQGTTNAVTVSGNTYNTTITSVNVTTTGNSKLMVWAHSGQILKSFDNANPQMNIQVAGTQIGSAHDGNHYWYATAGANSTAARVFLTQFGVSGTLAAGTHTVSLIAGSYGAGHTFNYQNQNCHMVIMEVGA